MKRLPTGIAELDLILGGGLPRHSVNLLTGPPGSGKTILAEQIAFANATPERPALYLSTLSEPLEKMLLYLQELEFVDATRLGREVIHTSVADIALEDPNRLAPRLLELITEHRPGVVIIDSFKAILDLLSDPHTVRRVVFELARVLSAYDATSFWIGEYGDDGPSNLGRVEFAVADGIITLSRALSGSRDDRFLHVTKLRGSGFRGGNHAFSISPAGLRVFPRLVSPAPPPAPSSPPERLASGIPELDDLIESGWVRGSSTLVMGPSGAGKTMLGLHFLREGVRLGEPGLLINFQESPQQLARTMRSLGWAPDDLFGPSKLDILYTSPVELHIDSIVDQVLHRVRAHGVKRVVIDALGDLEKSARDARRFHDYVYAFNQHFSIHGATTMLILEAPDPKAQALTGRELSNMADNLLLLDMDMGEELRRTIRIVKTRGSAHDGRRHELSISRAGLRID